MTDQEKEIRGAEDDEVKRRSVSTKGVNDAEGQVHVRRPGASNEGDDDVEGQKKHR